MGDKRPFREAPNLRVEALALARGGRLLFEDLNFAAAPGEFIELRGDMYEESIRFFTDAFQQDASVLSFFDADHTFESVTADLAAWWPRVTWWG